MGDALIWDTLGGLYPAKRGVTPDFDPGSSPAFRGMDSGVRRNDGQYALLGHCLLVRPSPSLVGLTIRKSLWALHALLRPSLNNSREWISCQRLEILRTNASKSGMNARCKKP